MNKTRNSMAAIAAIAMENALEIIENFHDVYVGTHIQEKFYFFFYSINVMYVHAHVCTYI
jgi:predicted metal-dependent hydrolase